MSTSRKFGLIFAGFYLVISFIGFSVVSIDAPIVVWLTIPTIAINLFGIWLVPNFLPAALCHPSGFMGCESSLGMGITIIVNGLLYFAVGLLVAKFLGDAKNSNK